MREAGTDGFISKSEYSSELLKVIYKALDEMEILRDGIENQEKMTGTSMHTTAMSRQYCEFSPGAHWQIQGANFRRSGNIVFRGKHGGLSP